MPPVILWFAGAAGALALAKWIVRESRRINAILHPEPAPDVEAAAQAGISPGRLRPDADGIYRPV